MSHHPRKRSRVPERENFDVRWKVHTPNLLQEILNNNQMGILCRPIQIFASLLTEVAQRASQLNDPKLNCLMARLALYEVADPYSPGYDKETHMRLLQEEPVVIAQEGGN